MVEGVAEYKEPQINDGNPYRIFVGEDTIKKMNATFAGKPVYVRHVDAVNLETLQEEADGYVIESFFNKSDGKNWAKFLVVSDKGHEAIRSGWKLSNAYIPKEMSGGGLWHGVEYVKEVMEGEYEHLAIVPNPRYEESIILTPEEFKAYNSEKEIELTRMANSKGDKGTMFKFFKKTKVENETDLESMSVTLPKSKKEKTIGQIINEMDEVELNAAKPQSQVANGEHMVKCGDEEMTVNALVEKHMALKQKYNEDTADKDAKAAEAAGEGELVPNAEEEKKENEEEPKKEEEKKEPAKKNHFDALKNAHKAAKAQANIDLSEDRLARGKTRYGS